MPNSYKFFKPEIRQWFIDNVPTSMRILDVGPGQGTYSDLLRDIGYRMDAVEVWAPYVDQFNLRSKYDNVYVADILDFNVSDYDFIILGDVLEHIPVDKAQDLLTDFDVMNKRFLVAVPYMMSQDGAEYGNDYETHHQEDLTPDIMLERYPGLEKLYDNQWYGYYVNTDMRYEKAYVLYATESYKDTVTACVASIKAFSDILIFVYMLNSDVEIDEAITFRWDCDVKDVPQKKYIDRENIDIYKILIQRPLIIKDALKYAKIVAYVDSDSVATHYVDNIFNFFPEKSTYPYFTEGIYDWMHSNGRGGAETREDLSSTLEHPLCELFGIDQYVRQTYRQTGYFVAGERCVEFLDEWYWMCTHPKVLQNPQYYAPYHEETVANVLLYKYKAFEGLPYIYINGYRPDVEFTGQKNHIDHFVAVPANEQLLLFYHGEKDAVKMHTMFSHKKNKLKLLYVAPHLSTGGMPQYLYEQAKHFANEFDIEVVDVTNSGGAAFVVQKNKISELFPVHTLSDRMDLLKVVKRVNPDIIHYHEVPQDFLPKDVLDVLFAEDSTYFNVVTTHSSYTDPDLIKYHADRYVFVCEWSRQKFAHLGIDSDVWEYPIINHVVDKKAAREKLELDDSFKHVLHVGLFTPGKNQGELFEIARQLKDEKILFHFVGNQAGNFKEYWKPLMANKPNNCIIWGERNDVETFYSAADLFYFPSKFELSPLSIKEALGHGLPCMFRRLHTYLDMYDNNPQVTYITEDIEKNKQLLLNLLK